MHGSANRLALTSPIYTLLVLSVSPLFALALDPALMSAHERCVRARALETLCFLVLAVLALGSFFGVRLAGGWAFGSSLLIFAPMTRRLALWLYVVVRS